MRTFPALPVCLALAVTLAAAPCFAGDKEDCATAAEQAQRLRVEKKLRAARAQIITCAREVCPAVIRNDCVKWLRDVDTALPTIIIRARDPQDKDLIKVKVTVDGQPFAGALDGTAQAVDTGAHTFRYEAEGMDPFEEQILISQGEKDRVLKVVLTPHAGKSVPKDVPVVTNPVTPVTPRPAEDSSSKPSVLPWVFGGIGVAGLVTFGVLETVGQLAYGSLRSGCGATAQKCTDADVAPVRLELQIAVVGLAVGVVGVGVAAGLLLFGGSSKAAQTTAQHLDVVPLPGGGYGAFKTTF